MLLLIYFHMAIVELFIKRSNITTFLCNSIYTHFASFSFLGGGVCVRTKSCVGSSYVFL